MPSSVRHSVFVQLFYSEHSTFKPQALFGQMLFMIMMMIMIIIIIIKIVHKLPKNENIIIVVFYNFNFSLFTVAVSEYLYQTSHAA